MSAFTEADSEVLNGPHVATAWFADINFPAPLGRKRLHTGLGLSVQGGFEWDGISSPVGGVIAGLSEIEEPRFGSSPAVDVTLSGGNKLFFKQFWDLQNSIEAVKCDLYFLSVDGETQDVLIPLKLLFEGTVTGLSFDMVGSNIRTIKFKVVSILEGLNYPSPYSDWTPAGQRARFPGDKGLDHITADAVRIYKS